VDAFYTETREQPQALRDLVAYYASTEGETRLTAAARALSEPLLTGMGASYHAALTMLPYWHHLGIGGAVIEATDLLNYGEWSLAQARSIVYLSQSGASAEVVPVAARVPQETPLLGITNDAESPLARAAAQVLPLMAGTESFVACKTYVNSLAVLWLLGRHAASMIDGSEAATLTSIADGIAATLADADAIAAQWLEAFGDAPRLVFVGHGPHAATARQCAMMTAEWAKREVLSMGVGAFRHGFIEVIQPGDGVMIFAPPGVSAASTHDLAREVATYGARVRIVAHGNTYGVTDVPLADNRDEWLSPLRDVIPAQLFVHALATYRAVPPGFRYISKVTTRL